MAAAAALSAWNGANMPVPSGHSSVENPSCSMCRAVAAHSRPVRPKPATAPNRNLRSPFIGAPRGRGRTGWPRSRAVATPVAMAMPNDAPAAASPTNLAPDSHAASTARKAIAPIRVAAAFRARVARMITAIAVARSKVPRTACTASATGPSATAAPKAAKIPFPWCSAGTWTYRFTHIPRPYSRSSITAALNALIRSPLPPRPASGARGAPAVARVVLAHRIHSIRLYD